MTLEAQQSRAAALRYARWLTWSTRLGLAMLAIGFVAYATGLVEPHVALERMPELWSGSATAYLQAVELEPGWHWAWALHRSDFLALAAIAFLASCSILCLAAAAPVFFRDGERTFAWLCVLEIAVIALAASGYLSAH